ncbi:MAG: septation protein A [Betaproteobacteria bacterium]|nr:septation protein A [Betaproteobacteria bacterium]
MKLIFDLLPVLLFFAAYKLFDIWVATGVAIAAAVLQISYLKLARKPVEPMVWIGFVIVVIAGGATLLLQDETFLKLKPTVVMGAMAIAIAVTQFGLGKNPVALVFNNTIKAPDAVWRKLSVVWIAFFLFMGLLNLYFVYFQSTEAWVWYSTFGDMGLMFVFMITQVYWLYPYLPQDDASTASTAETKD